MKQAIVLGIIGLVVVLVFLFPHSLVSPGELVEAHQREATECADCHRPFRGVPNAKCTACHAVAEIGKDSLQSDAPLFHAMLADQACTSCHTEHQGPHADIALGGFQHQLLSVDVVSDCGSCHARPTDRLHAQVPNTCKACHGTEAWKPVRSFDHTLLGADKLNACNTCHSAPADAFHALSQSNCATCHTTNRWVPSTFDHSPYFRLEGEHQATCATCHASNDYSSFTCYGCHEHNERDIVAEHREEGIVNITDCAACHRSGDEHDIRGKGDTGTPTGRKEEQHEDD